MDKKNAIEISKNYIKSILDKYKIEKVILFGSFAKGTNHEDSDIDLAIILKSIDDIIDVQIDLLNLRNDDNLLIEPHPFRLIDFNQSNPVASEILKHGIELEIAG